MLDNFQLDELAADLVPDFMGTYSRDTIPTPPSMQDRGSQSYILNMQGIHQGDEKGTHWVAAHATPHTLYYFDSYGGPAPSDVSQLQQQLQIPALWENRKQFQKLGSSYCGEYCLYWLSRCAHDGPIRALDVFHSDKQARNDDYVKRWYHALLVHHGKKQRQH